MERLAVFGGTFNPIHTGHLRLAHLFKEKIPLDRVIFMPTGATPGKAMENSASREDRLAMCRLAAEEYPCFEVSDYELNRDGLSYTVETLRHYKETYPGTQLYFILGSDMLFSLERWYCFEEICRLAVLLTAVREENELEALQKHAEYLKKYSARVEILQAEPYVVSSTGIRDRIKSGQDFTCYLPERVVQYIRMRKIYL